MLTIKVDHIKMADSFVKRLKGYMFHKKPTLNEVLIIKPCNQVHTFNMKFSIDVLFMDDNYRVLHKEMAVRPGKILPKVQNATFVAEGKTGIFSAVQENEQIRFELSH